jgi:hypothetical protein
MERRLLQWEQVDPDNPEQASFLKVHYRLLENHSTISALISGLWCFTQAKRHLLIEVLDDLETQVESNESAAQAYHLYSHIHSLVEAMEVMLATSFNTCSQSDFSDIYAARAAARILKEVADDDKAGALSQLKDHEVAELERLFNLSHDLGDDKSGKT